MRTQTQTQSQPRYSRGVSLLEVLFAVVILSIALLATARLHAMVTLDGSFSKMRGAAANLAQEKLDDLRTFTLLYNDPATTADECAGDVYCFTDMANDAGGKQDSAGVTLLPSGSVTMGTTANTTYNRTWTVANYYVCAAGVAPSTTNCTTPYATKPYPDFKVVTVTVSWTDERNVSQNVVLTGTIFAFSPGLLGRMVTASSGGSGPIINKPPANTLGGAPINNGDGTVTESSKLDPDISVSTNGANVSFDTITTFGDVVIRRDEYTTTPCECSFNGTGEGRVASRMVWNDNVQELQNKVGELVSGKVVGTPLGGQPALCDTCCRDHHDVGGSSQPKYDPDRPASEYIGTESSGNHKHYWYTACVSGTTGSNTGCTAANKNPANGYAVVNAGAYLESCRFKRVNGYQRLWQDWREIKMTVMPDNYLDTPSQATAYQNRLEAEVKSAIIVDSGGSALTTFPALDGRDFTMSQGAAKQLLGRVLYVDRVFQADAPTALDTVYYSKLNALFAADSTSWLYLAPYAETNSTLLIDWSSQNANKVTVTREPLTDISDINNAYFNSYSRGRVTAVAEGSSQITATARRHNSGLTGGVNVNSPSYGISPYDNTSPLSDFITVTVGSVVTSGVAVNGTFARANGSATAIPGMTAVGATCTVGTAWIANAVAYSCTVSAGATSVVLTYTAPTGYQWRVGTDSLQALPRTLDLGAVTSGQTLPQMNIYGPTMTVYGKLYVSSLASGHVAITTSTGQTCGEPNSDSVVTCTGVPLSSTGGWSGTLTLSNLSNCNPGGSAPCTYKLQEGATVSDVNSCNSSTTTSKSTGTLTNSPAGSDIGTLGSPTGFTFCAK